MNAEVNISKSSEAAVLVLLMGGINDIGRSDCFEWHDIHTKFHEVSYRAFKAI
jgi:hypothetical protein